jgi:hypothetical protein
MKGIAPMCRAGFLDSLREPSNRFDARRVETSESGPSRGAFIGSRPSQFAPRAESPLQGQERRCKWAYRLPDALPFRRGS